MSDTEEQEELKTGLEILEQLKQAEESELVDLETAREYLNLSTSDYRLSISK